MRKVSPLEKLESTFKVYILSTHGYGETRRIYKLNFTHSSSNQIGNSTKLVVNMTSFYVTDHLALE